MLIFNFLLLVIIPPLYSATASTLVGFLEAVQKVADHAGAASSYGEACWCTCTVRLSLLLLRVHVLRARPDNLSTGSTSYRFFKECLCNRCVRRERCAVGVSMKVQCMQSLTGHALLWLANAWRPWTLCGAGRDEARPVLSAYVRRSELVHRGLEWSARVWQSCRRNRLCTLSGHDVSKSSFCISVTKERFNIKQVVLVTFIRYHVIPPPFHCIWLWRLKSRIFKLLSPRPMDGTCRTIISISSLSTVTQSWLLPHSSRQWANVAPCAAFLVLVRMQIPMHCTPGVGFY